MNKLCRFIPALVAAYAALIMISAGLSELPYKQFEGLSAIVKWSVLFFLLSFGVLAFVATAVFSYQVTKALIKLKE